MKVTTQQLKRIHIFSQVDDDGLSLLVQVSQIQAYAKGDRIIHEGERFQAKLYAVLTGELLVTKLSGTGKETVLRRLPAGEMFAAPALFGDGIAPGTVEAMQASQIVMIDKAGLLAAIQTTPDIALKIMRCFNQRLQEMHHTIHGLVSERAIVRLARTILYTAKRDGVTHTAKGDRLNTQLPYQQIARMVGISYEECVRLIRKQLQGAVFYERGGIMTIQDEQQLAALTDPF